MRTHPDDLLKCTRKGVCFAGIFLAALCASAQETDRNDSNATSDEPIVLSPFEVNSSKDTGYVATNTLAGSRINTSLLDTPASISVMTKEFLDDIGALNLQSAMEYAVGAGNHAGDVTGIGLIQNAFNFQIRGYRDTTVTRNYFTTDLPGDSFNMERVDVARGPNSILFGIGGPGGIVNVTTKQARTDRAFGEVQLLAGSWDLRRGAVDYNLPLIANKLGVRVNLMSQRADGYYEFEEDNEDRGALDVVWRPTDSTTIRVNGETGKLHQNRARPFLPYDGTLNWKVWGSHTVDWGTPQSPAMEGDEYYSQFGNPNKGPDPVTGWPENRTAGHMIGNKDNYGWLTLMDGPLAGRTIYAGTGGEGTRWYRTSGSENQAGFVTPPQFDDESVFPRNGNIAGPGQYTDTRYGTIGATVDQRIGQNLNLEFAANHAETKLHRQTVQPFGNNYIYYDVVNTLPSFTADGLYDGTIGSASGAALAAKMGIAYVPTSQGRNALNLNNPVANPDLLTLMTMASPSYDNTDSTSDDYRLIANYHLDLGKLGDHMFIGFVSRNESESESQNYALGNIAPNRADPWHFNGNPSFTGGTPLIYHINPFSSNEAERGIPDPFLPGALPGAQTVLGLPADSASGGAAEWGFVRSGWNWGRTVNDSASVALQSRYWSNRIILTGGVRRDNFRSWDGRAAVDDWADETYRNPATGEVIGVPKPGTASLDVSDNTYTVGAVVHIPKVEWLSVFANVSTNFRAQGDYEFMEDESVREGNKVGPLTGKGKDFGLKFNLINSRLSATITRFDVKQDGAVMQPYEIDGNLLNYINAIWTTIENGGPDTVTGDEGAPNGHRFGGVDTRSQSSKGYEFELTANPTPNWRVSFNISKTENTIANVGGATKAYIEKHRAEWEANAGLNYDTTRPPGNLTNEGGTNTVGALITAIDTGYGYAKSIEGQMEVNSRPWNANLYTAYDFTEGFLKGLTIGGGVNYRGDAVLGIKPADLPTDHSTMFEGGGYYLYNAMLAYEFKLKSKYSIRLQLNVDNLLDNDDKQVLASAWNPNAGALETQYYFFRPRSYKVSATLRF